MDFLSSLQDQFSAVLESSTNPNSTVFKTLNSFQNGQFALNFAGGSQVEGLISVVLIAIGALMVFFGCRLFKATLFLFVFVAGAAITFYIGAEEQLDSKFVFALSILTGLFLGLLSLRLFKLALFGIGAGVAFVLWIVAKSLYPNLFASNVQLYAALVIPMIVLGIVSVYMEQYYLLIATPVIGSFMVAQGVDHFADLDINVFGTLSGQVYCTSDECYSLWAGVTGLALLGMLVQYNYTSKFATSKPKTKTIYKEKYVRMAEPSVATKIAV